MEVILFLLVIVALIVVHEFGHLVVAKLSGMRVDEFGIGYPPRALTLGHIGETRFTLNWLPFGGFVKIYGENGGESGPRAFSSRPRILQALVVVAGVVMNLLFAYVLITGALLAGTPRALSADEVPFAKNAQLAVAGVLPGSPAALAGLVSGDIIVGAEDGHYAFSGVDPAAFTQFVAAGAGNTTVALTVRHANGQEATLFARPEKGLIAADPSRAALGVEVATIGTVALPFTAAVVDGAKFTWSATALTAQGLWHFFAGVFTLSASLAQVSGPIGIAGAVGAASAEGFGNLLSLMAIISINLALINLIPIPALDGGRLLFIIIEGIVRRPIPAVAARAVNAVGFAFVVLLMIVVSLHDVYRLVG